MALESFVSPNVPSAEILEGKYCQLELLAYRHHDALYDCVMMDPEKFKYLTRFPHPNQENYSAWFDGILTGPNVYYIVWSKSLARYTGIQCYMRIEQTHGVIEIGDILWSSFMTRSTLATETIYLLLKYAFNLGYRRVEWKCDSLNLPSRNAALRFGFQFEGIFRQHLIIKGKNRDTAWYALLDEDWRVKEKRVYQLWLAQTNFDESGKQIQSLGTIREQLGGMPVGQNDEF
jgi:RimJ/RimL family protein N-acetyltransferase